MNARVLGCALALGLAACDSPTSPSPAPSALALGRTIQSTAFEFRYSANDTVDVAWQEAYHQWAIAALQVSVSRRIGYNKYLSRSHMGQLTGNPNTNGFADANLFEIHTIWPRDNHEVVHLYSSTFGMPVALWTEGLAVAFQTDPAAGDFVPRWSGATLDALARGFISQGRLVALDDLLTSADFRRFDSNVTYPEAGSFVRYVLDTCGLDGIKRLYRSGSRTDSAESVRVQFEAACGRSLKSAEQAWIARLANE